jgi:hypothetical protein
MNHRILSFGLVALLAALPCLSPAATLNVYHIGNSVTDTIQYDRLAAVAAGRGDTYTYGRHMIPGAPLSFIYDNPAGGFSTTPYGFYPNALPNYSWNAITLQPFDRQLNSFADNDRVMAGNFINLALTNPANASTRFLVYSRWPRRDGPTSSTFYGTSYEDQWDRSYTDPSFSGGNESRDYFQKVTLALRSDFPAVTIDMVPVGDVLYELASRMSLGQINHFTDISQIYTDEIHFYDGGAHGNVGSYLTALTFYATLFKDSPVGDTQYGLWGITDAALAGQIQDTVWDVVAGHPYSGVSAIPEPSTWLLLAGAGALAACRHRWVC